MSVSYLFGHPPYELDLNFTVSVNLLLPQLSFSLILIAQLLEGVIMDKFYCGMLELKLCQFKDQGYQVMVTNIL